MSLTLRDRFELLAKATDLENREQFLAVLEIGANLFSARLHELGGGSYISNEDIRAVEAELWPERAPASPVPTTAPVLVGEGEPL